jgi:hypothetical protein
LLLIWESEFVVALAIEQIGSALKELPGVNASANLQLQILNRGVGDFFQQCMQSGRLSLGQRRAPFCPGFYADCHPQSEMQPEGPISPDS